MSDITDYLIGLNKLGIRHEVLEHPELKEATDVQAYFGEDLSGSCPTLIMKAGDKFIALVKRGDVRLDSAKLKKVLGAASLRMANAEEFEGSTGVPVGAARVYNPGLLTLLDKSVFEREFLNGGSGSFTVTVKYKTEDLKKIPGVIEVDATERENMKIFIAKQVKKKFLDLDVVILVVNNIRVNKDEVLTNERTAPLVAKMGNDTFFENPVFKAFNRFCESLSSRNKKDFPSVENLYRRFEKRGKFPRVNNIVDIVNLVALESFIPLGVFDLDQIKGDMMMRYSKPGEEFRSLGGDIEYLPAGLLVISDEEKIVNLFPFQDSIYPNITKRTKNIVILGDVVEGIDIEDTKKAVTKAGNLVMELAGGKKGNLETSEVREDDLKVQMITKVKQGEKKRIFAGMRPTGRLHLGNYLGSAKGMLELQNNPDYETTYMVVDLHGITTPYDRSTYQQSIREVLLDYLAIGLDPDKSVLTVQSLVPEHIELAYLLSTVTTIAKMSHLPTYKEKVKQIPEHNTVALLNYPILMAADILIYKAELVPVGVDQEPHLEVAREIARRMNADYGTDFPEPQRFATKGEYVPSLLGEGKMSKSVEGSYISLTDDLQMIMGKLAKAPTDAGGPGEVPKTGPVANLFKFVELFVPNRLEYYAGMYGRGKLRYVEMKEELARAIYEEIKPIQEKRNEIERRDREENYVIRVIEEGAKRARAVAAETVAEVKKKMGLLIS